MLIPHLLAGTTRDHYLLLFSAAGAIGLTAGLVGSWIGGYFSAGEGDGLSLREHPGREPLRFRDALDLERDRIECLHDRSKLDTRLRIDAVQLRCRDRTSRAEIAANPRTYQSGR